jgi:predicted DNA-binding transcriptional regulator AlpA
VQERIKAVHSADTLSVALGTNTGSTAVRAPDSAGGTRSVISTALQQFDHLPASANVRLPVVIGLFGCSAPTVWRRVKSGGVPAPRKIGGTTVWNVGELRAALRAISE